MNYTISISNGLAELTVEVGQELWIYTRKVRIVQAEGGFQAQALTSVDGAWAVLHRGSFEDCAASIQALADAMGASPYRMWTFEV